MSPRLSLLTISEFEDTVGSDAKDGMVYDQMFAVQAGK